jgi:hypothetical protein
MFMVVMPQVEVAAGYRAVIGQEKKNEGDEPDFVISDRAMEDIDLLDQD